MEEQDDPIVWNLLDRAAALPRDARPAFLDAACAGDPARRARVEALLAAGADVTAGDVLPPVAAAEAPADAAPGALIAGRYKLLERIGVGGMGEVWAAEQTQPVRRKVALKLIKPGMDSRAVLARFEAERQALAVMDHANIAKVLDGGRTELGRPFFVMEYVKGVPITRYCDDARLSVAERLELFVPVCLAVQHAHQKGIIHRDLKPTNVMVTLYDGKPVPKVIDFGLAKATGAALTEHTLYTAHGEAMGTPLYMSPEQANWNNLDVDTRSDVYSLGVILYELLAGSTPLEKQRLVAAAWGEMLRLIKEEDPPRPSARLSGSVTLPAVAAQRNSEPAKLPRLIRGDLDWIVMKALEKERGRRYESASAFAADVGRHLADQPVEAFPPSAAYRLRKFVRRNRGGVVAASIVLLAIVGGTIGTSIGLWRAERARKAAVSAQQGEAAQRVVAVDERAIARAVSEFLQDDLLRQADVREQAEQGFAPNPNLTVREALDRAAASIGQRFRDRPVVEAAVRDAIGKAYVTVGGGVGAFKPGILHLQRALELRRAHLEPDHPATLDTMKNLATAFLWDGQSAEAHLLLEDVVKGRSARLGPDHRDTLDATRELAVSYRAIGRSADALNLQAATLKRAGAVLGRDDPLTLGCRVELVQDYAVAGRAADAVALQEGTVTLWEAKRGPDHLATLWARSILASCYGEAKRTPEAIALYERVLPLIQAKVGPDHPRMLQDHTILARLYLGTGRPDKAEPILRECLAVQEPRHAGAWATSWTKSLLGDALLGQQKYAEAEPLLLAGYAGMKPLAPKVSPRYKSRLAEAAQRLVRLYDATGKPADAATWRAEVDQLSRP